MDTKIRASRHNLSTLFGGGFGILWLLFWSSITLVFDGLWLWMIAVRVMTWSYASAEGTILESRVEHSRDSDGDTVYDAKIAYRYAVRGTTYRGEFTGNMSFRMNGGWGEAKWNVARYPPGKTVPVYYAADRPEISVLDRQLRGRDFFLPLFMTPFNIIMAAGWYGFGASWRKNAPPAGFRVRDDGLKLTARFYNITPVAAAMAALLASSFIMVFVCGFGMTVAPVDWLVTVAWCVVLGSAILAWFKCRQPATTLELDHFSGRMSITAADGRVHAFTLEDIVAVGRDADADGLSEHDDHEQQDGPDGGPSFPQDKAEGEAAETPAYPTITYRDATGNELTVAVAPWALGESSTWLVTWLNETLRSKNVKTL